MYSSRQKGQFIKLQKKLECPSCGRVAMVFKKGKTTLADGVQVDDINRWVCSNCGEELFNHQTMAEIRHQRAIKSHKVCA
jgi:YgiT-type zinc finger domain-containing protein